jgi:hypothetical protein
VPDPITITLAEKPYLIEQLTIGQLRDLHVGVLTPDSTDRQERSRLGFQRSLLTILAALKKSHPTLTLAELETWTISTDEMAAAVGAILVFSGLTVTPSASPGEASAPAETA